MPNSIQGWIQSVWYAKHLPILFWPLIPLSWLFHLIVILRKNLYRLGILKTHRFTVPIIVVGNITVGGTGKTPLVLYIAKLFKEQGLRPGIISRGYGRKNAHPMMVDAKSDPNEVGDEPVLLAKHLQCPLVVGKNRPKALNRLLQSNAIDVVISDDGLQHYGLHRNIEISLVDGFRRFGNGFCLPLGPLRESQHRLNSVDLRVCNGGFANDFEYDMVYKPGNLYNGFYPDKERTLSSLNGETVHAVAGIGHPEQFFQLLREFGLNVICHEYPDHHRFSKEDIDFPDDLPVLCTEKDFVKCVKFVSERHWIVPIRAILNPLFDARLLTLFQDARYG